MDDMRERIRREEGGLEGLMRKIPGFAGYKDREERRQADKIQRDFMADSLTRERERLSDVGSILMSHGGLRYLADVDRVRNVFDRVIERIRHATYGYGGFFDAIRINEQELDRVYEYDLTMFHQVAAIGEAITALGAAADGQADIADRLRNVEGYVKNLDRQLDERSRVMMGVN